MNTLLICIGSKAISDVNNNYEILFTNGMEWNGIEWNGIEWNYNDISVIFIKASNEAL